MADLAGLRLTPRIAAGLPDWSEIVEYARGRRHAADALRAAAAAGRPLVQPRCGVGGHESMLALLRGLESAGPGILSVTIDSHTRLRRFDTAAEMLCTAPAELNGYPLVAHGWRRGRELVESVGVPLEVRHGSPDARDLFAVAIAAGITSFEGGGIGYNIPYSKDVPLGDSLQAWREVDEACGQLAEAGVVVDRELFGTLTAVLVPPSISLAVTLLEAIAASRAGVRCLSVAYPQGGEVHQDVAALRAVRSLSDRYLGPEVTVHPVLHEFMGVFPETATFATMLIVYGGLAARLGGATKVVSKTTQEAFGIPDADQNALGVRSTAIGASDLLDFVRLDTDRVAEEQYWIEREVEELVAPILAGGDLAASIEAGFAAGRLDVPFSASRHARAEVVPRRDRSGAIRYADPAGLPFSTATRRHHADRLRDVEAAADGRSLVDAVAADIYHFLAQERRFLSVESRKRMP